MIKVYNDISELKPRNESVSDEIIAAVTEIIADVKFNGDKAVLKYTKEFDKVDTDEIFMSETERNNLVKLVPEKLRGIMERAAKNIYEFHKEQKQRSWNLTLDGKIMGQRVMPLKRVGMYVPGGTAAYPSSVLMGAIPATVAGVDELIMATPPKAEGINPAIIYAADLAGVKDIIKIGGAQAIAALAYGTESIKRADKIIGPGNAYVATAKRLVYGAVDIDSMAGPSDILIIADETANPKFIAADLLSQAEHDPMASSVLITTSAKIAEQVQAEIARQTANLSRIEIASKSIAENGAIIMVESIEKAIELSDAIAPEHLELAVADPFDLLGKIRNAGSIFLGEYSPEPLGDYYAGPNHILPTNGTARFSSALSVDSFMKKSSYLYYNKKSLLSAKDDVMLFAESEGLDAHANSIKVRFENE